MSNHRASLEITVNLHESVLSRKLVSWTSNWKYIIKYDLYVKFPEFLHTMYKYVLNSVVKISVMSAKYFEYCNIILRGPFLWTRCSIVFGQIWDLLEKVRCSSKMKPRLWAEWVVFEWGVVYFDELLFSRGAYEGPVTIFTDPSFEGCFYTVWRCLLKWAGVHLSKIWGKWTRSQNSRWPPDDFMYTIKSPRTATS